MDLKRAARWVGSQLDGAKAHVLIALTLTLTACQQVPYRATPIVAPGQWDAPVAIPASQDLPHNADERWWMSLRDPAVDSLVDSALRDSPDLAQALARIDSARAALGLAVAAGRPALSGTAAATRASGQVSSNSNTTEVGSARYLGLSFAWEADLFGRLRAGREAAHQRLDARTADAAATQVLLVAQIADRVVNWRACTFVLRAKRSEIASRQTTLDLIRRRVSVGMGTMADDARASSGLATAKSDAISQNVACARDVTALVVLSGVPAPRVREQLAAPLHIGVTACTSEGDATSLSCASGRGPDPVVVVADVPYAQLATPAIVLAGHPSVVAAEREVAAAWSDISAARASRYPRLNLTALLTGQWLHVGGQALSFATWSAGPNISGPILDGGSSSAQIEAAEARYREVEAKAISTVRASARDIEDALAATNSAETRRQPTQEAVQAAHTSLRIAELQWTAGASTLLNLEDARRQYALTESDAISAARDRAQAWIALVRATGNQGIVSLRTAESK